MEKILLKYVLASTVGVAFLAAMFAINFPYMELLLSGLILIKIFTCCVVAMSVGLTGLQNTANGVLKQRHKVVNEQLKKVVEYAAKYKRYPNPLPTISYWFVWQEDIKIYVKKTSIISSMVFLATAGFLLFFPYPDMFKPYAYTLLCLDFIWYYVNHQIRSCFLNKTVLENLIEGHFSDDFPSVFEELS